MDGQRLRARGDVELASRLLALPEVKLYQVRRDRDPVEQTRRQLLATAVRLTPTMAPALHAAVDHCRAVVGLELPVELYVWPSPGYNAFSFAAERGRGFVGVTSSILEGFEERELRFVIGHELGHLAFHHHDVPVGMLTDRATGLSADQVLTVFQWQRWAEISADRAGLASAGEIAPAASAFFKLASGLSHQVVKFDIDAFLQQLGDLASETEVSRRRDDGPSADWFSSHPLSPVRVRAVQLAAASELLRPDGTNVAVLEDSVTDVMSLTDPSYLHEPGEIGEAMRRFLLAGGAAVASADGPLQDEEHAALETLLGIGAVPAELNVAALRDDLDRRIARVNEVVPAPRRAQVIRDLAVIARADGRVDPTEIAEIRRLAAAVGVDPVIVDSTLALADKGLD
jgi:Zn-dependent protease with chaperone function/tellurite resistance protein